MSEERNPYAAPDAAVADIDHSSTDLPRPVQVQRACQALWISFGVNVIGAPFSQARQAEALGTMVPTTAIFIGVIFGVIFAGLVTWWFTTKLSAGRNWMRRLLNILFALSFLVVLGLTSSFSTWYAQSGPVLAALSAVQVVLSVAALVLINVRPSREWFLAMRGRPR